MPDWLWNEMWLSIPRLEAQRAQQLYEVLVAASPGLDHWARKKILDEWRARAMGGWEKMMNAMPRLSIHGLRDVLSKVFDSDAGDHIVSR